MKHSRLLSFDSRRSQLAAVPLLILSTIFVTGVRSQTVKVDNSSFAASGQAITAQVYDNLGHPIGPPSTYTSDGQTWDRLPITAPGISGSYYITVTVGSYSTPLGYMVY